MRSYLYVKTASLPPQLLALEKRRREELSIWISFPGCPFAGLAEGEEIQFPFPRGTELRRRLTEWLDHWEVAYQVKHE